LNHYIEIGRSRSPEHLINSGLKTLVEISTSTNVIDKIQETKKSILTWALIDSGAYKTHISQQIADYLKLDLIGATQVPTAGGPTKSNTYAIDLNFLELKFNPFLNIEIGSVEDSRFDLQNSFDHPDNRKNYGVWIGRDIMSHWHITWDGPSSTVTISD